MLKKYKQIDSPIYSTMDEIEKLYWNNWFLLTNIKRKDNDKGIEGGIVRFLADKCKPLYMKMSELDNEPDMYGDMTIFYMGDKMQSSRKIDNNSMGTYDVGIYHVHIGR